MLRGGESPTRHTKEVGFKDVDINLENTEWLLLFALYQQDVVRSHSKQFLLLMRAKKLGEIIRMTLTLINLVT